MPMESIAASTSPAARPRSPRSRSRRDVFSAMCSARRCIRVLRLVHQSRHVRERLARAASRAAASSRWRRSAPLTPPRLADAVAPPPTTPPPRARLVRARREPARVSRGVGWRARVAGFGVGEPRASREGFVERSREGVRELPLEREAHPPPGSSGARTPRRHAMRCRRVREPNILSGTAEATIARASWREQERPGLGSAAASSQMSLWEVRKAIPPVYFSAGTREGHRARGRTPRPSSRG